MCLLLAGHVRGTMMELIEVLNISGDILARSSQPGSEGSKFEHDLSASRSWIKRTATRDNSAQSIVAGAYSETVDHRDAQVCRRIKTNHLETLGAVLIRFPELAKRGRGIFEVDPRQPQFLKPRDAKCVTLDNFKNGG